MRKCVHAARRLSRKPDRDSEIHPGCPGLSTVGRGSCSGSSLGSHAAERLLDESAKQTRCRSCGAALPRSLRKEFNTNTDHYTWSFSETVSEELLVLTDCGCYSPTSRGFVMNTAFGATPNMSWWCQASGTSSPSGTACCMFMVATGTAPPRIQRASQGTRRTRRRGWKWKKRPTTWPLLAS